MMRILNLLKHVALAFILISLAVADGHAMPISV